MIPIRIEPVSYRLLSPIQTAHGPIATREGLILRIDHPDGGYGIGEATPLEAFGTESYDECRAALESFRLSEIPGDIPSIATTAGPLARTPAARHGVELALLDLLARRIGVPLARLFRADYHEELICNALIDGGDIGELTESAHQAVLSGFEVLKMKVGSRRIGEDVERVTAVRRAIGDEVAIRLDANGGWSEAEAKVALAMIVTHGIELCEQPIAPGNVAGLRRLRSQTGCPIAADESLLVAGELDEILAGDRPAADYLVLKPMALGGILTAYQYGLTAKRAGLGSYVTTLMDGPIARAATSHLASLFDGEIAHGLSTVELFEDSLPDPFSPRDGRIWIPDRPGIGIG